MEGHAMSQADDERRLLVQQVDGLKADLVEAKRQAESEMSAAAAAALAAAAAVVAAAAAAAVREGQLLKENEQAEKVHKIQLEEMAKEARSRDAQDREQQEKNKHDVKVLNAANEQLHHLLTAVQLKQIQTLKEKITWSESRIAQLEGESSVKAAADTAAAPKQKAQRNGRGNQNGSLCTQEADDSDGADGMGPDGKRRKKMQAADLSLVINPVTTSVTTSDYLQLARVTERTSTTSGKASALVLDPSSAPKKRAYRLCEHQRRKVICKDCGGGGLCKHQQQKSLCKECGGSSICEHKRQRSKCKDCGGCGICEHQRRRSDCKDCGGRSICEHKRHRTKCKECVGTCEHQRLKSTCTICREQNRK